MRGEVAGTLLAWGIVALAFALAFTFIDYLPVLVGTGEISYHEDYNDRTTGVRCMTTRKLITGGTYEACEKVQIIDGFKCTKDYCRRT